MDGSADRSTGHGLTAAAVAAAATGGTHRVVGGGGSARLNERAAFHT